MLLLLNTFLSSFLTILTPKSVSKLVDFWLHCSLKILNLKEEESLLSTIKEISFSSGIIVTSSLKDMKASICKKSVPDLL